MSKAVYVALWHLDTRADPGPNEPDWRAKLTAMQNTLAQAVNQFAQLASGTADRDPIKIFAAPEYYFAMGGDFIRGYDMQQAIEIRLALKGLSLQYPSILLVPGTVAWKEQMDRGQRQKVAEQLERVIADHGEEGRFASIGAHGARTQSGGTYRAEVTDAHNNIRLKGKNRFRSRSRTRWFGHNVAYVYRGGIQIAEINKSTNAGEFSGDIRDGNQVVMIPGFRSGAFDVPGVTGTSGRPLKMGLEICGDHGRLGNTFKQRDVDIHMLISASQRPGAPAARGGGLFIHCDNQERPRVERSVMMDGNPPWADRRPIRDPANTIDDSPDLYMQRAILEDEA